MVTFIIIEMDHLEDQQNTDDLGKDEQNTGDLVDDPQNAKPGM